MIPENENPHSAATEQGSEQSNVDVQVTKPGSPAKAGGLEVDLATAQQFIAALLGSTDAPVAFQSLDDKKPSRPHLNALLHGTLPIRGDVLKRLNDDGAGIFIVVNELTPGAKRKAPNVTAVRAFFVDLDGAPLAPLLAAALPPRVIVESSAGRYHAYWPVCDCPRDQFKQVQKRLADLFNGDQSVNDLPRVMRVPGFIHRKATPFASRIVRADSGVPYTFSEIVEWLEIARPSSERTPPPEACSTRDDAVTVDRHLDILTLAARIAREGVRSGMSRETMLLALKAERDQGRWDRPVDDGELIRALDGALEKLRDGTWTTPLSSMIQQDNSASSIIYRRVSDITAKPARGKAAMIAGDPGLGKSQVTAYLAAIVSTGGTWADGSVCDPGQVIMLNAEDDPADTIRPRLEAAGADLSRVHVIEAVKVDNGERPPNLAEDMQRLSALVHELRPSLIVIDPISAYLGSTDSHKNADVRALLHPLTMLAQSAGAGVICVSHLSKAGGGAMYRVSGSLAFVAAARAAFIVAKDKANPVRRLFLPVKNNIAQDASGLAFRVESHLLDSGISTSRVAWDAGKVSISADDALCPDSPEERSILEDAKAHLADMLAFGPVPTAEVLDAAKGAGFSDASIRRAKSALGVLAKKRGMGGGWEWMLPESPKALSEIEDAHPSEMSSFGNVEHLRE